MKNIFSQKSAFWICIVSLVLGLVGMAVNVWFFSRLFLVGVIVLVLLIIWKLYLITKGKEKWGVY